MSDAASYFVKWIVVTIFLAVLVQGGWRARLSYTGYCFKEERYLSDQEKIDAVITEALMTYPPVLEERDDVGRLTLFRPKNWIPYKDVNEFKRLNPNCCQLTTRGDEGYKITFSERLFGDVSTLVHIRYLVRYRDDQGSLVEAPIEYSPAVSNCGRIQG
jgi:hypothetical protein